MRSGTTSGSVKSLRRDPAWRRALRNAGIAPALLWVMIFAACSGPEKEMAQPMETVRGLRIETSRIENVPDEIEAPGSVVSAASAQIAARTMGTVMQVAAREGDTVRRGELLVLLDDRELLARRGAAEAGIQETSAASEEAARALVAAQAQADLAKKTYDRFTYLQKQNSVSAQEFDEVEAKYRAATASLEQAKARQRQAESAYARAESEGRAAEAVASYARVVAPFDGVVVRRMVDPGTMVSPGMPLFVVEDASRYRLEATIPASEVPSAGAGKPRIGSSARVRLDALQAREFTGKVVEFEAGTDLNTQTIRTRIALPRDPALRSGLFGRASFRRGDRSALVIPQGAVVERGQLRGVFILDSAGAAGWRLVTLGIPVGDRVEILSGIGIGERYIADPDGRELDGKKVEAGR